ncbi:hypothetical protein [Planktotalea sp.]|uniref:hypothetical protein n=1 Tax=Planktotalea sp. TaxID=2029877 RepID=UPI00329A7C0A
MSFLNSISPSTLIAGLALASAVSGCEQSSELKEPPFKPEYQGVNTRLLDGDLVNFQVKMTGARETTDVDAYAECAAAQYALIRGYGFARHLRTSVVEEEAGLWLADAVYTISPALPRGSKTIDAEVTVSACAENKIPTV